VARILGLLIPGTWQILCHKFGLGLLYFCLYTFSINGYFMSPFVLPRHLIDFRYGFIILAAVVWVVASYPMFLRRDEPPEPPPQAPAGPTPAAR
jgi:hypothetical protein